ncbi:hypothetical protein [Actinacidiphila sp. ITFR-21]|uniref:hypothetical protein n=1 Tax=Actinacidiphila sp. ITFR-21 TaxID=3075199 RepID=UPI00288AF696|nr:hypothetical protein [Streptomyces sp. ITFR-21]WNI16232.1 hypothetical protein RLT57_12285 [Streptomyces sp. ITFR-21]
MSTPGPSPRLKSLTTTHDHPGPAQPARATAGRSTPKTAARQGAPSAVRPDSHTGREPRVIAWLRIIGAPGRGEPPRAISRCRCGRHLTATGQADVIALVQDHAHHRTLCTLHTATERKQAA